MIKIDLLEKVNSCYDNFKFITLVCTFVPFPEMDTSVDEAAEKQIWQLPNSLL